MDKIKLDIDERRCILNGIQQWNNGITQNGQLAPESCFVHHSVPNIIMKNFADQTVPTSTKSEWTENLLQSGVPTPYDPTTQESLSLCRVIFKDDLDFIKLDTRKKSVVRYIRRAPKAYVKVNNIARLTTEFTDELSKAEEHWPHNPKRSRDMLHDIWNRYGFLWPRKLYIEYETSQASLHQEDPLYKNSRKQSKDRAQDSLKISSVVFRSNLRPLYEFFPPTYIREKKFILEVLYHFSPSMLILKMDVKLQSQSCINHQQERTIHPESYTLESSSVRSANVEHSVASVRSNRKSSSLCLNEKWRLSADSSSTYANKSLKGRSVCSSLDYDGISVNREFSNTCTDIQQFTPQDTFSSTNIKSTNYTSPTFGLLPKSPFSITSFDDRFDFSSGEQSESNSTQPTTSGSNSISNSFIIKNAKTDDLANAMSTAKPIKSILLKSAVIDDKTDDKSHLKKKPDRKTKQKQLDTVIEEIEKCSMTTSSHSMTCNDTSTCSSINDNTKHSKFTTFHPTHPTLISSFVPNQVSNFDLKEGFIEKTMNISKEPEVLQCLNGYDKSFSLSGKDTDSNAAIPANGVQIGTSSQYSTPEGSIKSVRSEECVIGSRILPSLKKQGKQPAGNFQAYYQTYSPSGTESEDDDWTSSSSLPSATCNPIINLKKSASTPALTEAETFKREVQQTYGANDKAYNAIYKNIFLSTPTSNTTSHIRYYDDEDEDDVHQIQGGSSQLRSYTMTPRSRFSQQTRSSSANLTAEEYMLRKKSRETSFMMLVPQETKQQLLIRAVKQSTLSQWLQNFSANAKKTSQSMEVDAAYSENNDINTSSNVGEIRLHHCSNNNRTIKKKKGFYRQKVNSRRENGIIL